MNTRTNRRLIRWLAFAASLLMAELAFAQTPAGAPAGATGLCNDGTYYTGANKRGACRGHKGVKQWFGASQSSPNSGAASPNSGERSTAVPSQSTPEAATQTATTPRPGGGADKVWVNTQSNVYHCPGTRYYGKTKAGAYMTEAEATAKGARPDHGNACR
jgi:hypothetical protein